MYFLLNMVAMLLEGTSFYQDLSDVDLRRHRGYECLQAPYFAGAQLAHFAEQGVVQTIFGPPGLLLYGALARGYLVGWFVGAPPLSKVASGLETIC